MDGLSHRGGQHRLFTTPARDRQTPHTPRPRATRRTSQAEGTFRRAGHVFAPTPAQIAPFLDSLEPFALLVHSRAGCRMGEGRCQYVPVIVEATAHRSCVRTVSDDPLNRG